MINKECLYEKGFYKCKIIFNEELIKKGNFNKQHIIDIFKNNIDNSYGYKILSDDVFACEERGSLGCSCIDIINDLKNKNYLIYIANLNFYNINGEFMYDYLADYVEAIKNE